MTRGALHLVGGGRGDAAPVWRGFVEAAGPEARLAVLVVREDDAEEHTARLVGAVRAAGPVDAVVGSTRPGGAPPADTALVLEADGARVAGRGTVWWVEPAERGVLVRREPAAR